MREAETRRPPCPAEKNAKKKFPRGLVQPETGYRFSMDPLLAACFAKPKRGANIMDLGTGCGVAALALLLQNPEAEPVAHGLDIDPAMIEAARENGRRLGAADRFTPVCADLRGVRADERFEPESFDLVLANPPYRDPGSGRIPQNASRRQARFETEGTLADFIDAAAYLAVNRGVFVIVFLAERLRLLSSLLAERRLEPKRLQFAHSRREEPARLVLVEAVKNGRPDLTVEPPLFLYEGAGKASRLTEQALTFCPFLACNSGFRD